MYHNNSSDNDPYEECGLYRFSSNSGLGKCGSHDGDYRLYKKTDLEVRPVQIDGPSLSEYELICSRYPLVYINDISAICPKHRSMLCENYNPIEKCIACDKKIDPHYSKRCGIVASRFLKQINRRKTPIGGYICRSCQHYHEPMISQYKHSIVNSDTHWEATDHQVALPSSLVVESLPTSVKIMATIKQQPTDASAIDQKYCHKMSTDYDTQSISATNSLATDQDKLKFTRTTANSEPSSASKTDQHDTLISTEKPSLQSQKISPSDILLHIYDFSSNTFHLRSVKPETTLRQIKTEMSRFSNSPQIQLIIFNVRKHIKVSDNDLYKRIGDLDVKDNDMISYDLVTKNEPSYSSTRSFDTYSDRLIMTPEPGLRGLENTGNKCFMNSALQCLSNIPPLTQKFLEIYQAQQQAHQDRRNAGTNKNKKKDEKETIVTIYANFISDLWSGEHRSLEYPRALNDFISKIAPRFASWRQQDSFEFMSILLDELHEAFNDGGNIDRKIDVDENADDDDDGDHISIISELFYSVIKTYVRCLECQKISETKESLRFLSFPITENSNRKSLSLTDCLENFTAIETFDDKNAKWYCSQCNKLTKAKKQVKLFTLPKILLIQLKRFNYDPRSPHNNCKIETMVTYPLKCMNLNAYLTEDRNHDHKDIYYDLICVSKHMGSLRGGHYVTYAKNVEKEKWYCFDDRWVNEIDEETVVTRDAYILVYAQRKLN